MMAPDEPRGDNGLCTDDWRQLVHLLWGGTLARLRARLARLVEPMLSDPLPPRDDERPPDDQPSTR